MATFARLGHRPHCRWCALPHGETDLGAFRGQPYPDPPPITPLLVTYVIYLAISGLIPERNSIGERLNSIAPIRPSGNRIDAFRWTLRLFLISLPWGAWILLDTSPGQVSPVVVFVAVGLCSAALLWSVADVFLLCLSPVKRTLTDRLLDVVMVLLPPRQPHRAPAGPMFSASDAELGVISPPRNGPKGRD